MTATPEMIAVAVVEDDDLVRTAWVELLNDTPGMRCALACASAEEALDLLADHEPEVVLMDIQLPGMSGIEAVRRARPVLEGCDFLMLTVHDDDQSVFQSLCAGASGYLLKDSAPEEVIKGIRDCVSGGSAITPGIARMVVDSFRPRQDHGLTDREREVLQRLCDGENHRGIAERLSISPNTVKAHIKRIYGKLHVHTRAQAVRSALREGLA
ncbi:MAG: response regulator transcription factor [Flavobacteriales bacterium]